MKRFYLALAMLAALPAAASAQTILNEGFETTSTDQYSPNFPDGWSTVDSYTGNNDRYRWNVYYYEKGTMTGTHCASVDGPMFTGGEDGGVVDLIQCQHIVFPILSLFIHPGTRAIFIVKDRI